MIVIITNKLLPAKLFYRERNQSIQYFPFHMLYLMPVSETGVPYTIVTACWQALKKNSAMTQQFWVNLPVKDISRSKAFFTALGFSFSSGPGDTETSACLLLGAQNAVVMLFAADSFRHFSGQAVTDTSQSTEVLFSFDAESRQEVDELADKVTRAGGTLFAQPSDIQGWMYGCGFSDPDGHRWNVLYMDKGQQG